MDTLQRQIDFRHQVFSIPETAQHMRISRAMVYKLIKAGQLKLTKIGTRSAVTGDAIDRCLSENGRQ